MSSFTPVTGLLGGSLIGAAAAVLLLANGDIMGLSGIFASSCLHPIKTANEQPWKFVFLASFLASSAIFVTFIYPACIQQDPSLMIPSILSYILGGLLVGFGTKLGNGCTSGHGICGLPRLSKRSIVAVLTFMATGILTTIPIAESTVFRSASTIQLHPWYGLVVALVSVVAAVPFIRNIKTMGACISGAVCAIGLSISGMILPIKIQNFLDLTLLVKGGYDPTLITVMGGGVIVSWLAYQLLPAYSILCPREKCLEKPFKDDSFHIPSSTVVDWKLVGGAAIFGVGWGMSCFCPGPAFVHVAAGNIKSLLMWFPAFLVGAFCAERVVQYTDTSRVEPLVDDQNGNQETVAAQSMEKEHDAHYGSVQ